MAAILDLMVDQVLAATALALLMVASVVQVLAATLAKLLITEFMQVFVLTQVMFLAGITMVWAFLVLLSVLEFKTANGNVQRSAKTESSSLRHLVTRMMLRQMLSTTAVVHTIKTMVALSRLDIANVNSF